MDSAGAVYADGDWGGTTLVKDINQGSGDSSPSGLVNVNGTLFFSVYNGTSSGELWKSDGTEAGTERVKVICSANCSPDSIPTFLTDVNGMLFFVADDGQHGKDLWISDGTQAGTVLVTDGHGAYISNPDLLVNMNGTLYFSADDSTHGNELWAVEGYSTFPVLNASAELVMDIKTGPDSSYPSSLVNVNGTLFFVADDGTDGYIGLWKLHPPDAPAFVKYIHAGPGDYPDSLTNVDGTLFFWAYDDSELWKSNGTEASTQELKSIHHMSSMINLNGTLFFSALDDQTNDNELWTSNGTSAGTKVVKDINPNDSSNPDGLTNVNGMLFFAADDGTHGIELWKSDGSETGTVLVKDINPNGDSSPYGLTNVNGTLFFAADDGTHGPELWKSDGSEAGTVLVMDINPGSGSSAPSYLTNVSGRLFFAANDGQHGKELWISDPPIGPIITSITDQDACAQNGIHVFFHTADDLPFSDGLESMTGWSTESVAGSTATWTIVSEGTHPTCTPYNGSAMAKFNSYDAGICGYQARLYRTSGLNLSRYGYTSIVWSFFMYHDTVANSVCDGDWIQPQISIDGTNWYNIGDRIDRPFSTDGWEKIHAGHFGLQGQQRADRLPGQRLQPRQHVSR